MKWSVRLLYPLAFLFALGTWAHPPDDYDLGWHLLGGEYISQHHALPARDFINAFNHDWVNYSWLVEWAYDGIYRAGGFDALRLANGLVLGLFALVMVDIARRGSRTGFFLSILGGAFFSCMIATQLASIRPQMVSALIIALALHRLVAPTRKWEIEYLFALTVLLANIHVNWVFIPFLWVVYRGFGRSRPSRMLWLGGAALLSSAGMFTPHAFVSYGGDTPNPFIQYALLWEYLHTGTDLTSRVCEFKSVFTRSDAVLALTVVFGLVVMLTFRVRRLGKEPAFWLSGVLGCLAAVLARKFSLLFCIWGTPLLVRSLERLELAVYRRVRPSPELSRLGAAAILLGLGVAAAAHTGRCVPWRCSTTVHDKPTLPIAACGALAKMPIKPDGRPFLMVLTHFNYGGWCRWQLHQNAPEKDFRVTTDGRTQWVPNELYERSFSIFDQTGPWERYLKEWSPDAAVVPHGSFLEESLLRHPDEWLLGYTDENFTLLIAARHASDFRPEQ